MNIDCLTPVQLHTLAAMTQYNTQAYNSTVRFVFASGGSRDVAWARGTQKINETRVKNFSVKKSMHVGMEL